MKKLLATILALVMALGLCSVSWADDVYTYENGELKKNGTAMTADEVKAFSGVNVIGFKATILRFMPLYRKPTMNFQV